MSLARCSLQKQKDDDGAQLASSLVAYALGLPAEDIMSTARGSPAVAHARHIAMYLTYASLGMSLTRVAAAFERDRSTVSHGCRLVEERRDDGDFDGWLEQLEEGLRSMAPLHGCQVA